jgi:hypothetical protein
MDAFLTTVVAGVIVAVVGAIAAFYFGGAREKQKREYERQKEEQRQQEERQKEQQRRQEELQKEQNERRAKYSLFRSRQRILGRHCIHVHAHRKPNAAAPPNFYIPREG